MQEVGLNRNTIDKFYTKSSVVDLCAESITRYLVIDNDDLVIEPSAGNGSFIPMIKTLSNNVKLFDIDPFHDEITRQDYLTLDYSTFIHDYPRIHIVGNPPFGRQASMAIKFIKKSCEFCHSISFILPKSFKKDSLKNKFPINFHLICEIDLPENSFTINEKEHNVPCVFQIWEKRDTDRFIPAKLEPKNFEFVEKTNNPDISFRRVGVNAGYIDSLASEKSIQSHYFIKFTNEKSLKKNIKSLKNIKFDDNNTVGPRSISKQELINQFNKMLK